MRLLLRKHLPKLGTIGEIVDVKPGYGRNFLIPGGYALPVTSDNLRRIELERLSLARMESERSAAFDIIAKEIQRNSVTIRARVQEDDESLYGSINERMISEAYGRLDIEFDYRVIVLEEPIKKLGTYNAEVRLHRNITAYAKVIVMPERDQE